MWFDLGPLTPDEWGRQNAWDWTDAVQCRNAAQNGIDQARQERASADGLTREPVGQVG